ncbi:MAG TPA: GNAT family N-acetyltransferase [Caulifigura sp.]|nr:GNAT family N-acetyltransferase [Caulifigura sp.]
MSPATTFSIRLAQPGDAEVITRFNCLLAEETEDTRLHPPTVLAGVKQLLADPAKGRYLVAEIDRRVVGQLAHTREWSDWRNGDLWWIQSVYVHADYRGAGVFRGLYEHLERLAEDAGNVVGIRLYVEKHNDKAQSAYGRLGLVKTDYEVMQKIWAP